MKPFVVPVNSVEEAHLLLDTLAAYDKFQFDNKIKPDYSNVGGLSVWDDDSDGEGTPGWIDWEDPDTGDDFDKWRSSNLSDIFLEILKATNEGI
jgi:hypothetical protein